MKLFLPFFFLGLISAQAQLHTQVGDVKDDRTADAFFSGLDVDVKFIGDALGDAQSIRARVKTAVDDTGRNLIDPKKEDTKFEKLDSDRGSVQVTLKLKSPARKAESVKEISGEAELYEPKNDPGATLTVPGFQKIGGKPIDAPALKAAGIEITTYTKEQADAMKAKKEAERKKNVATGIQEALEGAFSGMFGMDGGPNSILLYIKDPNDRMVDMEFQDASGKKIETEGSSSSREGGTTTKNCNFESKLPDSAQLVIHIMTPKTIVKVPFTLTNIFLP